MAIEPGQQLLHYRLIEKIGEGGMGVVWRATDTTLDREVALKFLSEEVATDDERLARFKREAKLLAALDHPNIATVYGLHSTASGKRFIAMELIEGVDLAQRLSRGPLALEEAVGVARQIAEAVETAHETGVIHRDLKPANVKLTADGKVKVLDFGLAKAVAVETDTSPALSPTVTAGSVTGAILGTAAYMSPEQAEGKPVDKRTDIWAFGVMLFEMLTGRRLFEGGSVPKILGAIFHETIPLDDLPAGTPGPIRALVGRCLQRDPRQRLRDVGEARIALQARAWDQVGGGKELVPERSTFVARAGWALATIFLIATIVVALRTGDEGSSAEIMRFTVSQASGATVESGAGNSAVSPDGRAIIFVGVDAEGHQGLWVQPMDEIVARFLPGTEDARYPFWSPDSTWVAFFADGKLKRVALDGGRVEQLCDASDGRGGSWSRKGVIVFSPSASAALWRVDAEGGTPTPLTHLDAARDERSHRYPCFLSDGEHYTFLVHDDSARYGVYLGRLGDDERTQLMRTGRAPIYADPGYLIFAEDDRLVARRLDLSAGRLTGAPLRLTEQAPPSVNTSDRVASVSDTGLLVLPSPEPHMVLAWLDREGRRVGEFSLPRGNFAAVRVSPDGKRMALDADSDIWVADIERGTTTRVTFAPETGNNPIWSPDGRRLAFHSDRNGPLDLFAKPIDGSGETVPIFSSPTVWKDPQSWSHGYVAFESLEQDTGYDIWVVPDDDPGAGHAYVATAAEETSPRISPNGRWLAYTSNESGQRQVYVQSFPEPGVKYQVTTDGGIDPLWSEDGTELFCRTADGAISAIPVTPGDGLTFGTVHRLFPRRGIQDIDVAPGGRFAAIVPEDPAAQTLIVVINWTAQLTR